MKFLNHPLRYLAIFAIFTLFSATTSHAKVWVLDFENVGDFVAVSNHYNGGTDGAGNHGVNLGVSFSKDALGIKDLDVNFDYHGNFANEPSGSTVLLFLEGGDATMNVESGFNSAFSFFYSSSKPATIKIYDGLDGTGNLLAELTLAANHTNGNCQGDRFGDYCHWDSVGVTFNGQAKSVVFDGPPEYTYYDNITLGSSADLRKNKGNTKQRRNRH